MIDALDPRGVISGCALGFDWALASAASSLSIPWVAAVPFRGQESRWPDETQSEYRALLARATKVVVVCEGAYTPCAMQVRNEWMVRKCNLLLALHNGDVTGGTSNCLRYADQVGRDTINLWSSWLEFMREVPADNT